MKLRKPTNKGKKDVSEIIIPNSINNVISFLPNFYSEHFGFLYGIKDGGRIYIGSLSHLNPTDVKEISPKELNLEGESGQRYIKLHNKICEQGEKLFPNFTQVAYHSHPKLLSRDFTKTEKQEILSQFPKFKDNLEELVKQLDNAFLSEADKEFAKKYSSHGTMILSLGKEKDLRNINSKYFHSDFFHSLYTTYIFEIAKSFFTDNKTRLMGFQVDKNKNTWEMPVTIAENTGAYIDEKKCYQVMEKMKPFNKMHLEYIKSFKKDYAKKYPVHFKIFMSALEKFQIEINEERF
ncbi:MAG: hypothetical protein KJ646_00610 [Nanoarchaeota archaeon]|nr:hypothetical protein [Nanoarchaeota archaeon]MBU4116994.1 hypothetical protein [Nanoarchaeota archaeon]